MRARVVATAGGALWLAEGARIFLAAPFSWLFLVSIYYSLVLVASLVPLLGLVAVALTTPAFTVGLMAVARAAANRARPELPLLLDGFRHHARAQLVLGGFYLAFIALLIVAIAISEADTLRAVAAAQRAREPLPDVSGVFAKIKLAAAVYGVVMMVFWFAPVLAAWHGVQPMKALFFSMAASLMNWRAFLVFGALVVAAIFVTTNVLLPLLEIVSGGQIKAQSPQLLLPFALLLAPPFYAGLYASYRDVFATPEPAPQ